MSQFHNSIVCIYLPNTYKYICVYARCHVFWELCIYLIVCSSCIDQVVAIWRNWFGPRALWHKFANTNTNYYGTGWVKIEKAPVGATNGEWIFIKFPSPHSNWTGAWSLIWLRGQYDLSCSLSSCCSQMQICSSLATAAIVNCPTRWSLLLLIGYWCRSSIFHNPDNRKYSTAMCYSSRHRVPPAQRSCSVACSNNERKQNYSKLARDLFVVHLPSAGYWSERVPSRFGRFSILHPYGANISSL